MKEIEVFEFLKNKSNIKGLNIDDLYDLFKEGKKGIANKGLVIKMIILGKSVLILNTKTQTSTLFNCVKTNFNEIDKSDTCAKIRNELELSGDSLNCCECYCKCIKKYK